MQQIRPKIKIISYEETLNINDKKNKNISNKTFLLEIKNLVNLITYLPKTYSEEKIKHLYKQRWVIETYFSTVKNNFNLERKNIYFCDVK